MCHRCYVKYCTYVYICSGDKSQRWTLIEWSWPIHDDAINVKTHSIAIRVCTICWSNGAVFYCYVCACVCVHGVFFRFRKIQNENNWQFVLKVFNAFKAAFPSNKVKIIHISEKKSKNDFEQQQKKCLKEWKKMDFARKKWPYFWWKKRCVCVQVKPRKKCVKKWHRYVW